jgi:hypothetical protein
MWLIVVFIWMVVIFVVLRMMTFNDTLEPIHKHFRKRRERWAQSISIISKKGYEMNFTLKPLEIKPVKLIGHDITGAPTQKITDPVWMVLSGDVVITPSATDPTHASLVASAIEGDSVVQCKAQSQDGQGNPITLVTQSIVTVAVPFAGSIEIVEDTVTP